eukprot:TRINITY_DN10267_c0_g1_i1.p2 TRINITY_DN10267_c0_g1~~TRINITY_DN10267_c0_g1_i1.p2  ORF type:complete len:206 (-),score=71.09 TRINITY_DN10267_c0_g1_i1:108-725(-)
MDSDSFFGLSSVPPEIKASLSLLPKLDPVQFRKTLQFTLECLKGSSFSDTQFTLLSNSIKLPKPTFTIVFTGLIMLFRLAIRQRSKSEEFQRTITDLHIQEPFSSDMVKAFHSGNELLQEKVQEKVATSALPSIVSTNWRIDVTISTTSLSRVMKPVIMMQLQMSDGRVVSFDLPMDKFHEMRFAVAKVLKEMDDLSAHPILRIE